MVDVSDLNPVFAQRLAQFRDALTKAGIANTVASGYRSPEYQQQLYANYQAKQAGRPLPFPTVNQGSIAAPPWQSFHNYGLAADVTTPNSADYQRMWGMAPQYGLAALGQKDIDHFQLAGNLSDDIAQYHLANWRPASQPAPAQGAIAYAGPTGQPSRPGTPTPGTSINSSPLDIVLNAESGDSNINNTHQGTSSGQAQGNLQITTGTWNDFAPKAGVDLKRYPTPDSAPRDVQIQVGNTIPLNRWANSTVQAVLAKYPGIDTSQTLGAIQSAAINPTGASGSPASAPAAVPATPVAGSTLPGFQPGSPANKMAQDALKKLGGGGQPAEQPQAPPLQMAQSQAIGGPMMMRAGGQNVDGRMAAQNNLAQQGFMMQPTLAANSNPMIRPAPVPQSAMPGAATGVPGLPGTTLNSPSQMQMALMSGQLSPYDVYANANAGYGFGST